MTSTDRRAFLQAAGLAGAFSALSSSAFGQTAAGSAIHEKAQSAAPEAKHSIRFGVIGLDHAHIYGMTQAVQRGGGKVVAVYGTDKQQIADFLARFGDVKVARSEHEILEDKSIQLILGAPVPDQRAPLGVRAMRAGKDYLADKPGIVTLEQLEEVRRAVAETGRKFAIMYSERLEVRSAVYAGELIKRGAIGKVIQTINLGPHRVNAPSRPD